MFFSSHCKKDFNRAINLARYSEPLDLRDHFTVAKLGYALLVRMRSVVFALALRRPGDAALWRTRLGIFLGIKRVAARARHQHLGMTHSGVACTGSGIADNAST